MKRLAWLALFWAGWATAAPLEQLVFGSFRNPDNAERHAARLTEQFQAEILVDAVHGDGGIWYRVRSGWLTPAARQRLEQLARATDQRFWIVRGTVDAPRTITSATVAGQSVEAPAAPVRGTGAPVAGDRGAPRERPSSGYLDIDLGLQARAFKQRGLDGQDRWQPSVSARVGWQRSWEDGRQRFTAVPFVRLDGMDDERTHFDLREFFWSRVADDWDLHVGFRQVFWGVTEFKHLVDIINQTDLVENVDGEQKLGQPMVQLSLVRDWGILDLFLLTGFRERTFPGTEGRLRWAVPVDTGSARYTSGAGQRRIDGAIRWSHDVGPLSFGIYHFAGTSRDPLFEPLLRADASPALTPVYTVIDQTGLDGQWIRGDWSFKFEGIRRSGFGDRYHAFNAGFERTLVGVLGTRADLGLVVEYLYDQRGAAAFDTLFERDLAVGTRWSFNDAADSQALAGLIVDQRTRERVFTLEASRRLGDAWLLTLESRLFAGAGGYDRGQPPSLVWGQARKSAFLHRDDYFQFELTRFF
jgi:hypothetical protein